MTKKDTVLLAAIILLAAALTATVLYIRSAKQERISESYIEILREIDSHLREGYTDKAASSILSLARTDVSAATYLQLLKRAYSIAGREDEYETFLEVARLGHEAYPAREDLEALLVFAYMRTGSREKAWKTAEDAETVDQRWDPVYAEAALAAGAFSETTAGSERTSLYTRILESEDPEAFEEAWKVTGSASFLLDAVLLHMMEGNIYEAAGLANQLPGEGFAKLMFYLAYDTERWARAEEYLREIPLRESGGGIVNGDTADGGSTSSDSGSARGISRPEKLMLEADIALHRKNYAEAAGIYERVMQEYPDYSWNALYNLAFIGYERGEFDDEEPDKNDFFSRLYSAAEEDPARVMELAELMLAYGDNRNTEHFLAGEGIPGGDDPQVMLLREKAKVTVNPERYTSLLRILVNRSGGERYAAHLAWFLMGIENYRGLEELISYFRQVHGEPPWLHFYTGVIETERGAYEEALSAFSRSLERESHWQTYYNMAMIAALQNDPTRAVSLLDEALDAVSATAEDRNSARAAVLARRAEVLYRYGEPNQAAGDARRALGLDPANTAAQLILTVLESGESE